MKLGLLVLSSLVAAETSVILVANTVSNEVATATFIASNCDPLVINVNGGTTTTTSSTSTATTTTSTSTSVSVTSESSVLPSSESSSESVSSLTSEPSSVSASSESSSSSVAPGLRKRQATFQPAWSVQAYACGAGPVPPVSEQSVGQVIFRSGKFEVLRSLWVFFASGPICQNIVPPIVFNCVTTTVPTTTTAVRPTTIAPAVSVIVSQSTTVNLNVNIVISNCAVCAVQTVYHLSAYVCTNTIPVVFFGVSYPCARVGAVCQVTCPYVLTPGQVSTILVAAASTAPVVPYVATVIQGQSVSVPAYTLPNVVATTVVAPKPVVTYTGGANQLGMGAAAVIAGAAALL